MPLLLFFGVMLTQVIIEILLNPAPTNNIRRWPEKKKDPPGPPTVDDPPETDPPNKIKPPPTEIFVNPPNDKPLPPGLPKRILPPVLPPSGTSTNTENSFTSTIKESLLDHKFGCLLSRPFYSTSEIYCEYENTTFSEFYEIIKSDMETEKTSIENDIDSGETGLGLRLAPAFLSFDNYSQPIIIVGSKQLHKISSYYAKRSQFVANFPITGLIAVGETIIQDCTILTDYIEEPKFLTGNNDKECAVPIAMFDELEGYKADQLQIIWRNNDWGTIKKRKSFTIPYPKAIEDYTIDSLKGVFPSTFTFGKTVIDIRIKSKEDPDEGIKPIHKCIIMTNHQTLTEIDAFVKGTFKGWLESVSDKAEIKDYVTKFLDKSDIWVGDCVPYRAVLMGWDKEKKYWFNKADWFLG